MRSQNMEARCLAECGRPILCGSITVACTLRRARAEKQERGRRLVPASMLAGMPAHPVIKDNAALGFLSQPHDSLPNRLYRLRGLVAVVRWIHYTLFFAS